MAKAKRIYELAKELGVESKAIVQKCQQEQVPDIKDHMSTVKVGLAMTIRQWFSETHDGTAVEQTEQVDLKKVRKRARRKAKQEDAPDQEASVAVATQEEPPAVAQSEPVVAQETPASPVEQALPATVQDAEVEILQPEAETIEAPKEAKATSSPRGMAAKLAQEAQKQEAEQTTAAARPKARPNVPMRPENVGPAGEQLTKPKSVQLKGPRVIRVEQPDRLPTPGPRRTSSPPRDMGPTPGEVEGISRSRGPVRGVGVKGGNGADRGGPSEADRPARKTLRQRNVRRGRTGDTSLPTGPSRFTEADMEELDARLKGASGFVKQRRRDMRHRPGSAAMLSPVVTGGKVVIQEPVTIKNLSSVTGIKSADIVKYLFQQGVMATINSAIETAMAMEVAMEHDIELDIRARETALEQIEKQFEQQETLDLRPRPPVVAVLGHVDHGKTSLLDRIRKADVASHEDGGITQHVGAYRVTIATEDGREKTVVFLDTPGHEAFTSMRSRGAQLTDIVVLVVAADDGVMPQTIESINHAKAAGVPVVVALNKIDRAEATEENIRRIYGQLAEHGLNPVEWGGETEIVKTSAITGQGATDLIEVLDYQAELQELKADYGGRARGTVIEAEMQTGRGAVARVLVQQGQMKVGDFVVIGRAFGRVRDMSDERSQQIQLAGPSTPLELSGIDMVPDAGDKFYITESLQAAESVASQYREHERQQQLATKTKVTLDNFAQTIEAGRQSILRVVLKADVQGSMEVLRKTLEQLGNEEVAVRVLHAQVGGITESDVLLADASDAIIIGFHVGVTPAVREIADHRDVDIRIYRVIYDVTDEVRKGLEGLLAPETREEQLGIAEVREVFRIGRLGNVAGCVVQEGVIQKTSKIRVLRDGIVVTDQRDLDSLRRVKDDVREVRSGTECGIRLTNFEDLKPGDQIVAYRVEQITRKLV